MSDKDVSRACIELPAEIATLVTQGINQSKQTSLARTFAAAKFAQFEECSYATVDDYFGGLEPIVGPPHRNLATAIKAEHTGVMSGSGADGNGLGLSLHHYTMPNMEDTTNPSLEYALVFDNSSPNLPSGKPHDHPGANIKRQHVPIHSIRASAVAWFQNNGFNHVTQQVFDSLGLRDEEIGCLRLYTGPMYEIYNAVLRQRIKGLFTTTIHLISSGLIKISRVQPSTKLYRGLHGRRLPGRFSTPDALNTRGGVELGFTSATTDSRVALQYGQEERGGGYLFEMLTGMVTKGASLGWLSYFPNEMEVCFPPCTAIEVRGDSRMRGRTTVIPLAVHTNPSAATIEDLLGQRRKFVYEFGSMLLNDVSPVTIDDDANVNENISSNNSNVTIVNKNDKDDGPGGRDNDDEGGNARVVQRRNSSSKNSSSVSNNRDKEKRVLRGVLEREVDLIGERKFEWFNDDVNFKHEVVQLMQMKTAASAGTMEQAMFIAVKNDNASLIKQLLQHGGDPFALVLGFSIVSHSLRLGMPHALEALVSSLTVLNLSGAELAQDATSALARLLRRNKGLKELNLTSNMLSTRSVVEVVGALHENGSLETLLLADNNFGSDTGRPLGSMLRVNCALKTLNLEHDHNRKDTSFLGDAGAVQLVQGLAHNNTLTSLNVAYQKLGQEGLCEIASVMAKSVTLRDVNISLNRLKDDLDGTARLAIGTAIMQNRSVTSLNLHCMEIDAIEDNSSKDVKNVLRKMGRKGLGQVVGEALAHNDTLTDLRLSRNRLCQGDGFKSLMWGLKRNKGLKTLNVAHNDLMASDGEALAECLKDNSTLTELKVNMNKIRNEGALDMMTSLSANTTLKSLDLRSNKFGAEGGLAASQMLAQNTSLTELDLSFNDVLWEAGEAIAAALGSHNTTLTKLNLEKNGLGPKVGQKLVQAIQNNSSLLSLNVSNNELFNKDQAAITDKIRENNGLPPISRPHEVKASSSQAQAWSGHDPRHVPQDAPPDFKALGARLVHGLKVKNTNYRGEEGRVYCGDDLRKTGRDYHDGSKRWCRQRKENGVCDCDGVCGPASGCQCKKCYMLTFYTGAEKDGWAIPGAVSEAQSTEAMSSLLADIRALRRST